MAACVVGRVRDCVMSHCVVLCLVFGGESALSPCGRERSYAQIDIANFWGDTKLGLYEACCMFLIYVQLGFLVGNP